MYFQPDGTKLSLKKESTSASNQLVAGTGEGNLKQWERGLSTETLSVSANDGSLDLSSSTNCCSLCQSRFDITLSNEPTLAGLASTPPMGFVTKAGSDKGSESALDTLSLAVKGLDSMLKEKLVSPDPDSLKLMLKLMTTDNLQEKQVKQIGKDTQTHIMEPTTNCYKGMFYPLNGKIKLLTHNLLNFPLFLTLKLLSTPTVDYFGQFCAISNVPIDLIEGDNLQNSFRLKLT